MTDVARSIVLSGVAHRFRGTNTDALADITTELPTGEVLGLVGPDGAGKTTLLRLVAGLLKPSRGTIAVKGLDPARSPAAVRAILGYMPQKFGLYEDLTVRENLDLYADLRGVIGEERTTTFARLLQFTSLAPFTARPAGKLSGGMKQKLGLA